MFTMLKPFLKYNATISLALALFYILTNLESDKLAMNYLIIVYFPILELVAPISFGICYGNKLFQNYTLSLGKILKLSIIKLYHLLHTIL